jgi:hypothetical protein
VKIPCPQCGGEIRLQETGGFVGCPFCGASLILDLTGVHTHLLYRPRRGPGDIVPLLRRWCDGQRLTPPSGISSPHLVYQPFWRFAPQGRPQLVPAWATIEARWSDITIPDAEQVIYDPAVAGTGRVVEPSVTEAAARARLFGEGDAPATTGELVHVPFYEVQATINTRRLGLSVDACSGRVYPDRMPPSAQTSTGGQAGVITTAMLGLAVMFLEAMVIPPTWLATGAVALTAVGLYWALLGSGRG